MLNIKKILLVVFGVLFLQNIQAQKGTQSPYSAFGLGERNYEGYAAFASMSGVAMGNTDSTIVNSNNPASYSYISRHLPIFQLGLNGKLSTFSNSNNSSNQRHFGFNQFQMGLPIAKNWGGAIAIKPYTFTGYAVTRYGITDEDTTLLSVNEGSGGIRMATFGLSYRPLNKSKRATLNYKLNEIDSLSNTRKEVPIIGNYFHRLSLGFNLNYLFGTSEKIRTNELFNLEGSVLNSRVVEGKRVSGATLEAGVNYQIGFSSTELKKTLSVGGTFSPATQVRAFQDLYSFSYSGSFYRASLILLSDTIELVQDNEGVLLKPETIGVGLEYRLSSYKSNSSLRIGADFKMEKWSTFYTEFSGVKTGGNLKDRLTASVGLEYIPRTGYSSLDPNAIFLSRLKYRFGFTYSQTELQLENNLGENVGIDNYGMSFGLGIPILTGKSNTNINFGASLGNLGTTENGLIQERYVGLYFGLSITPQASNRWFIKRKYN